MRVAKWAAALLGSALILILITIGIVAVCIDPNRYRAKIEAIVGDFAGKPLKIHGDLRLTWFPRLSVEIGSATLGSPSTPLIEWRTARVGTRLLPLLQGQVIIDRIHLDAPRIHLLRDAQGHGNWEGIGAHTGAQSSKPAQPAAALQIGATDIEDGQLEYSDEANGSRWTLSNWKFQAGAWQAGRPISIATRFTVRSDSVLPTPVPVEIDLRDAVLSRAPLAVRVSHFRVRFADALLEGDLNADVPGTHVPDAVSGVHARGALTAHIPSARNLLSQLQPATRLPQDPDTFGRVELTGSWSLEQGVLKLQPLDVQLDATRFTGWVARSIADSAWKFELHGDRIDLKRYLNLQKAQHDEPFVLPVEKLRALRADGVVMLDEAQLADTQLKGVRMRLTSTP